MASTTHHMYVGKLVNKHFFGFEGEDERLFLLGNLVVDSAKKPTDNRPNTGRITTHFLPGLDEYSRAPEDLHTFDQYLPDIEAFVKEYETSLTDPFTAGVLTHLITDKLYFGKLCPRILGNHDIPESFTNRDWITFTREHLYGTYSDHDYIAPIILMDSNVPDLSRFEDFISPVKELDNEAIQEFITENVPIYKGIEEIINNKDIDPITRQEKYESFLATIGRKTTSNPAFSMKDVIGLGEEALAQIVDFYPNHVNIQGR